MTAVCKNENSANHSDCKYIAKVHNEMAISQHTLCQNNTDWSNTSLNCQELGHIFFVGEKPEHLYKLEHKKTADSLDIWVEEKRANFSSGKNGAIVFALCSPPPHLKATAKILATNLPERDCPVEMSQEEVLNHLNKRQCPPMLNSSLSLVDGEASPAAPMIDLFLNPARANELEEVKQWVAEKWSSRNYSSVSCMKKPCSKSMTRPLCLSGGSGKILPKFVSTTLALSIALLPLTNISRPTSHAQVKSCHHICYASSKYDQAMLLERGDNQLL